MNLSTLDNVFWAAGFIGHGALFLILVARKRVRDLPVFAALIAFEALTTVLLFVVSLYGTKHGYFLCYWITGFGDYLFQIALILEIARDVLRPTGTWVEDARKSFFGWGAAGLIAALIVASQIGPPQSRGLDLWDVRTTVFTSLLTCGLFIAMSAVANSLGLQRRSYVMAVGQGLAVWGVVALLEEFGHVALGANRDFAVFVHVRQFIYLSVLFYWTVVFWFPEKARAPLSPEMEAYLLALHERVKYDLQKVNGPPL